MVLSYKHPDIMDNEDYGLLGAAIGAVLTGALSFWKLLPIKKKAKKENDEHIEIISKVSMNIGTLLAEVKHLSQSNGHLRESIEEMRSRDAQRYLGLRNDVNRAFSEIEELRTYMDSVVKSVNHEQ